MARAAILVLILLAPLAHAKVAEPAFVVEMETTERTMKPQAVAMFPAEIVSRSSQPLKLSFDIVGRTGSLQAVVPPPTVLGPEGEPKGRMSILFTIQTPYHNGNVNETGTVTYRITPRDPASNATLAQPHDVTLKVHTVGFYAPGPQFFGVFLALALAAFLLRPRR